MIVLLLDVVFIMALASALIVLVSVISKKSQLDREKSSPFECGFDPFSNSRIPFSLRFYMISIIFLIFDVEIAIILPLPISMMMTDEISWFIISMIFILTLFVGLIHEWNFGSLDWAS